MDKQFLICSAPRSGSHLFARILRSTQLFGGILEFVPRHLLPYCDVDFNTIEDWSELPDSVVIETVEKFQGAKRLNGVWVGLILVRQLGFLKHFVSVKGVEWNSFKMIWLRRRNLLKRAISGFKAHNLQQYAIWSEEELEKAREKEKDIEFDSWGIKLNAMNVVFTDYLWESFFDTNNISPHVVFYEDFEDESNWSNVLQNAMDFLEIPYEAPSQVRLSPMMYKQSTDWNDEMYQRFLAEERENFRTWEWPVD